MLGWCSSPERLQWSECLYFSQPLDISILSSATLINLSLRTICPFGIQTFQWFSFLYRNTRHTNLWKAVILRWIRGMARLLEAHTQVLFQTSFLPRWLLLIHNSVSSCGMKRCLRGGCMSGDVTPAPWSFIGAAAGAVSPIPPHISDERVPSVSWWWRYQLVSMWKTPLLYDTFNSYRTQHGGPTGTRYVWFCLF